MTALLAYISSYVFVLPIIYALFRFNTLSLTFKVLFVFILGSVITDTTCLIMMKNKMNNIWVFNLYSIFEAITVIVIFRSMMTIQWLRSLSMLFLALFIVVFFITRDTFFSSYFNNGVSLLQGLCVLTLSFGWFYNQFKTMEHKSLTDNPDFWVVFSLLFYFSTTVLIFLFSNYVLVEGSTKVWFAHNIIHLLFGLLILFGFWKYNRIMKY